MLVALPLLFGLHVVSVTADTAVEVDTQTPCRGVSTVQRIGI